MRKGRGREKGVRGDEEGGEKGRGREGGKVYGGVTVHSLSISQ